MIFILIELWAHGRTPDILKLWLRRGNEIFVLIYVHEEVGGARFFQRDNESVIEPGRPGAGRTRRVR